MIQITVGRDDTGIIHWFRVKGHADSAQHGQDIVCAAVSVLTQNAVNTIEELLGVQVSSDSRSGFLECKVPMISDSSLHEKVQLLLESMVYGLRAQAMIYPSYVGVNDTSHN